MTDEVNVYDLIESIKRKLDHMPQIEDLPIKQSDKLAYLLTAIDELKDEVEKLSDEMLHNVMVCEVEDENIN